MNILTALDSLANSKCFIVYRLDVKPNQWKLDKVPVDPRNPRGYGIDPHGPDAWMTAHDALAWAQHLGLGRTAGQYGVGIVLTEALGIFCIDVDDCVDAQGNWSPHANAMAARFPGAAMELSVSGRGFHIFARTRGPIREHCMKCAPLHTEAYDRSRFIALTGEHWAGSIDTDHTEAYDRLLAEYFPPRPETDRMVEWTDGPVAEWDGPQDDRELIERALRSHGAGAVWGGRARFADLFNGNADVLSRVFPSVTGDVWDRSNADLALFNHLAFWTGNDCVRMERLGRASALCRDKWERPDYLRDKCIIKACATQREWYKQNQGRASPAAPDVAGSDSQGSAAVATTIAGSANPGDGGKPPAASQTITVSAQGQPVQSGRTHIPGIEITTGTKLKPGECPAPGQIAGLQDQQMMFKGCVYVEDMNMAMMPDGILLDSTRFNTRFPGLTFVTDVEGSGTTRSAWEVFVDSEQWAFPKVRGLYFAPKAEPGAVVWREGMKFINSWVPVELAATQGDYAPFLNHLKKLLPVGRDADILLYYMAAIIQNPGVKFSWWPFIQGVPGNGKSFLCEAIQRCVGGKFTHAAKADRLGSNFNAAFYGKLFVRIDEVKIDHSRGNVWESIKLLITQETLEIEPKGVDPVTREVCFNGILLSNYKNGIRKTAEDRRICPLFCAQQTVADLYQQGMVDDPGGETSQYFDSLWAWAETGGWEIIRWLLLNISIPDIFNPAKSCRRAPVTSSTMEAVMEGWGVAEQEVQEAIEAQHEGFRAGWISSTALDTLLARVGKGNAIPRKTRVQLLHAMGYIFHPALVGGRVPARMTDGSMPVLFMLPNNPAHQLTDPAQVVQAFIDSQKVPK